VQWVFWKFGTGKSVIGLCLVERIVGHWDTLPRPILPGRAIRPESADPSRLVGTNLRRGASFQMVPLPVRAYNHLVPTFMCRWPNGDVSFVSARNKEDAVIMLDEWDNAELAELRQIRDFMVDFRLTDDGELDFHSFGEHVLDDIWERAYPLLAQTRLTAQTDEAGELTLAGQETIREAVRAERQRLRCKRKRKLADTELGKSIQSQMDASAVLVNRYVKQAASEVLKKTPTGGRKN
jgi:hypothetical protein